jgi:phosphonate transport system substrate-binding protein
MMTLRAYIFVGLCLLLATPLAAYPSQEQAVRFGSVAEDTPAAMHQRLIPLTDYLKEATGRNVVLALSPDMPAAIKALSNGDVELAYLTPVAYLNARKTGGAILIAKAVTNNQSYFRLEIVVREDSPIKSVADLAGKSFAFGDPAALLQNATVVNAGMPLESLGKRAYLGHYDNIARGVLNRDYDAGIVTDSKARKWNKNGLRVIYSSEQLPPYNIAAKGNIDDVLYLKLQAALLKLDRRNPNHGRVLDALGKDYDGFAKTSDAEYDVIRKLIKPFQR